MKYLDKVNKIRNDFPFLKRGIIYLDSASTSLKPKAMIEEENNYSSNYSFNVLRSANVFVREINDKFISSMESIGKFINASKEDLIFTYNSTYASNEISLILEDALEKEDEILISNLEHSSTYMPWVKICQKKGSVIKDIKIKSNGLVDIDYLKTLINSKTKIIILSSTFNTIGSTQDIEQITKEIKQIKNDIYFVIDATQSIGHFKVDVKKWNCDFMFFSSHKALGSTGLGILYIKTDLINKIEPLYLGGGMNSNYSKNKIEIKKDYQRFLAGTPNISAILSFAKSIEYLNSIDLNWINEYNKYLKNELEKRITNPNIKIINKGIEGSILLFKIDGVDNRFVEYYLSLKKIIIRSGLFCVKTHNEFVKDNNGSLRVSFHFYNSLEEVETLADILNKTSNEEYNKLKDNEFIKGCSY